MKMGDYEECPNCGSDRTDSFAEREPYQLGAPDRPRCSEIVRDAIVWRCKQCDFAWTGWEDELLANAAYRESLLRERVRQLEEQRGKVKSELLAILSEYGGEYKAGSRKERFYQAHIRAAWRQCAHRIARVLGIEPVGFMGSSVEGHAR